MRQSAVLHMVRTKRKARTASVLKSVTEADIKRATVRGADVRRVWELQNVQTKKYPDLVELSSADILQGELRFFCVFCGNSRTAQRFARTAIGTRRRRCRGCIFT
jgi:hypothetical protein